MPISLSDLREAMTVASGATPLVPKIIDRLLLEYVRRYAPIRHAIPRKTWEADVYWFNQRNQLPKAQATTEAPSTTDVAATTSNYLQKSFTVKHLQAQLDISTFAAKVEWSMATCLTWNLPVRQRAWHGLKKSSTCGVLPMPR